MKSGKRRHQLFSDRKLQGALLAHTSIYWFYCLFSVTLIAVCWIIFTKQPETSAELFTQLWLNCGPALLGSILLLPLVLLDCLRLTSRFAGPMVRMQRVMRELADGQTPPAFALRPNDHWTEFAENMNIVLKRIRKLESDTVLGETATSIPAADAPIEPAIDVATATSESSTSGSPFVSPNNAPTDGSGESPSTAQSIYSDLSI